MGRFINSASFFTTQLLQVQAQATIDGDHLNGLKKQVIMFGRVSLLTRGGSVSEENEIVALGRFETQRPHDPGGETCVSASRPPQQVVFSRTEIATILNLYGKKVAAGEWRDYAMNFGRDKAVFAVYRRSSEMPLYRIEKNPKLARKQGAYSVVSHGGIIVRRGHDLAQVLKVLLRKPKVVIA